MTANPDQHQVESGNFKPEKRGIRAFLTHQTLRRISQSTPITTAIKDLESDTFETSALIAWLQSLSVTSEVPVSTPDAVVATPTPTSLTTEGSDSLTPTATEHLAPDRTITGKTTFQELIDWGVTLESIQNSIGYEIPFPGVIIKDFTVEKGLAFSDIKTKLQIEIDQLP